MTNKAEIRRYINVIRRAASLIEAELDKDSNGVFEDLLVESTQPKVIPVTAKAIQAPVVEQQVSQDLIEHQIARKKHIQDLMDIDSWPEAMPSFLTATQTEADQKNRACAVLDTFLDRGIEGLSFLDFGCGDGWITREAMNRGASVSLGYDIIYSENWKKINGPKFTTKFDSVKDESFDLVMLFDVLDHCEDPQEILEKVEKCIKKTGVIYVRCHPWTSRHATHLYKDGFNKAYLHMFLSWDEIKSLTGKPPMFTRVEKNPLQAYRWWFSNFKIVKERPIYEDVSDFFKNQSFKDLLAAEQSVENVDEFLKTMRIQFVDYTLTPKS